jgi:glycogen debranching enzyme
VARFQQESGKIPEYWDARTGRTEDYGLNVNDDTPLFVLAAGFHSLVCHDKGFMRDIYPAEAKAARYLISQKDNRGLVVCTATAKNTWGICSWRNVIPDITLSGAVTEINAECYGALAVVAQMAKLLGNEDDFDYFSDAASALRDAINTHLLNPSNGLYYLNIDLEGKPNPDVTSDEIFPVLFGVALPEVAFRIVSRLVRPDFITSAGLRTASRNSPEYTPDRQVGLRGGVWPGVAFWFARAAAPYYPEATVTALSWYQHYNENPRHNNTVPGQFSEWFDGESLANRGMRLSPWEPPRMLWAAITGMLGLQHHSEGCTLEPHVPDRWKWLGVSRMPHGDGEETLFLARLNGQLHLFHGPLHGGLTTDLPHSGYERVVTNSVESLHPNAHVVALEKADEVLVCVGSSDLETATMPLEIHDLLQDNAQYRIDLYDSEMKNWITGVSRPGKDLRRIASSVEPGGFRLYRLARVRP